MKKHIVSIFLGLGLFSHVSNQVYAHGRGMAIGATIGGAFGGIMGGLSGSKHGALEGMALGAIGGGCAGAAASRHSNYHHDYYCTPYRPVKYYRNYHPTYAVRYARPVNYRPHYAHKVWLHDEIDEDYLYNKNQTLHHKNKQLIKTNRHLREKNNEIRHQLAYYDRDKYKNTRIKNSSDHYYPFKSWKNISDISEQNESLKRSNKKLDSKNNELRQDNRYLHYKLEKYQTI